MSLCLDQAYCTQSTKAAEYFSKCIYDNLNTEEKGKKSKRLYELAVPGEIDGGGTFFNLTRKTIAQREWLRKLEEQRCQSGKSNL